MVAVFCWYRTREKTKKEEWEVKEHHQSLNPTLVLLRGAGTNNESKKEEKQDGGPDLLPFVVNLVYIPHMNSIFHTLFFSCKHSQPSSRKWALGVGHKSTSLKVEQEVAQHGTAAAPQDPFLWSHLSWSYAQKKYSEYLRHNVLSSGPLQWQFHPSKTD